MHGRSKGLIGTSLAFICWRWARCWDVMFMLHLISLMVSFLAFSAFRSTSSLNNLSSFNMATLLRRSAFSHHHSGCTLGWEFEGLHRDLAGFHLLTMSKVLSCQVDIVFHYSDMLFSRSLKPPGLDWMVAVRRSVSCDPMMWFFYLLDCFRVSCMY